MRMKSMGGVNRRRSQIITVVVLCVTFILLRERFPSPSIKSLARSDRSLSTQSRAPYKPSIPAVNCTAGATQTETHLKAAGCLRREFLGDEAYGGWTICYPRGGLEGAVIYTVGVGRNIEWDKDVIRKYHTIHHGWDPTPTAEDFFKKKAPPVGFIFHTFGLGAKDGTTNVKLPVGLRDSWTITEYKKPAQEGKLVSIEVRTLQSLLKIGHHTEIAILKIDIEGAEFDVIKGWAESNYVPPAHQILVEFHERFYKDVSKEWKELVPKAVRHMERIGFALINKLNNEYTFVKSPCVRRGTKLLNQKGSSRP